MVWTYFCLNDLDLLPVAQRPQYFSDLSPLFSIKYFPPILRREYDMILAIPFRSVYKELHADRETGC